ncbi:hypothetical protein [Wenyingzhuangia sp. IMCC45574]
MPYTGLNNKVRIISAASANVDFDYGPYNSISEALTTLTSPFRTLGKTVGIISNGSIEEYWFKEGILDIDLIQKQSSSEGSSSGNSNAGAVNYILDGSVVDQTTYFSSQYSSEPIGTRVVDTVENIIYEKVSDTLWIKNLAVAVGTDIDSQATITGINLVSYK